MDEKQLVDRAKNGSRTALEWLIKLNSKKILGTIISMTRDEELSKDIFQETCIKVYRNIKSFKGDSAFSTWAISIAKHIVIDEYRKMKRQKEKVLAPPTPPMDIELHAELLDLLNTFTDEDRQLILLKYHYGYTYEEVGERVNMPAGTVRSRIHYALKKLKGKINE